MRREVTLEEISDGRLYDANDMVLSLIHISEPTRQYATSRMPSSA